MVKDTNRAYCVCSLYVCYAIVYYALAIAQRRQLCAEVRYCRAAAAALWKNVVFRYVSPKRAAFLLRAAFTTKLLVTHAE